LDSFTAFQSIVNATDLDAPYEDAGARFWTANSRAAAQRLRRMRQRLGSYRHDLVVAMRIINGLEREMVQSEWENWLADENSRCDQLRMHLEAGEARQRAGVKAAGEPGEPGEPEESEDRKRLLQGWHDHYCGSCRKDVRILGEEMKLSFQ
jgi:nucleotide-binding universal stress UspA family protein